MKLQELLNKFNGDGFLITVPGWCDELPFSEYEDEKKQPYWSKYKNRTVIGMSILTTNERPELCIALGEEPV